MKVTKAQSKNWSVAAMQPPTLRDQQWNMISLLGIVLIAMAVSQLVSFNDFKAWLADAGFSGPSGWAVGIIIAEVWAAAGFFKIRLSYLFRVVSAGLALVVSGFWFVLNLQLISNGTAEALSNSGFFGRFLPQAPGWWTVLEAGILLFWTLYALGLFKASLMSPSYKR